MPIRMREVGELTNWDAGFYLPNMARTRSMMGAMS